MPLGSRRKPSGVAAHPELRNTKGRPKGSQNQIGVDLKGMILKALSVVGGYQYLVKIAQEQPAHFIRLLSMIVPREVSHSGVLTGVSVHIHSNIALGSGSISKSIAESEATYIPSHDMGMIATNATQELEDGD